MYSEKFHREIVFTAHASLRMRERGIDENAVWQVIETGDTRYSDATHFWAYKEFPERADNLICTVVVLEDKLVVKTVMHHFSLL